MGCITYRSVDREPRRCQARRGTFYRITYYNNLVCVYDWCDALNTHPYASSPPHSHIETEICVCLQYRTELHTASSFMFFVSGEQSKSFACGAGLHTPIGLRATYVMGTYMLRLSAAHKTVTQVGVITCMLRKQVPTKVLLIA